MTESRLGRWRQSVRRQTSSIRVRIVFGYIVLLTTALAIAVLVTRQVQINGVERDIAREQRQEIEEIRVLASGTNPGTGRPFGTNVRAIFGVFLDRNIPLDDEAFYTLIGGREYRSSTQAPDLYEVPELISVWSSVERTTETRLQTDFGEVWSLAVPLEGDSGEVAGVFAVVSFPDDDQREVNQVVRVIIVAGLLVLVVTSALAWSLAGRVLRPVRELTATARGISDSNLSGRIPVEGNDELAELGRTFNEMVDRLAEGFASQRRFLDDVAHELRTPITIVRGYLETAGDSPEERAEVATIVGDELDRMSRYVSELLLLAKAERPDFLNLGPVDLGDLAATVMQRVAALGDRNWVLDEAPNAGAVAVVADQERLEQAVTNLAGNAVDHTGEGGEIGFGIRSLGASYQLWVRDTGAGIEPEILGSLFSRYSRGVASRSRPEGMGIGLSIVDAIARAHGGTVSAVSPPGAGATFIITAPADPEVAATDWPPPADHDISGMTDDHASRRLAARGADQQS